MLQSEGGSGFGEKLQALRLRAGLSQEQLARRSGLSDRTISRLEQGHSRHPRPETARLLAEALQLHESERADFIPSARWRQTAPGKNAPNGRDPSAGLSGAVHGGVVETSGVNDGIAPGAARVVIPRQLPAVVRAFAGREHEIATLSGLLLAGRGITCASPMICVISGTAGVGKTALAIQWASSVAAAFHRFPDGQLYADLRGWGPAANPVSPADLISRFLEGLGVPADKIPTSADARSDLYRSVLAGKRMLIVLDNARDSAQVRPLLPGGSSCAVLITSRSQLGSLVASEAACPLALDVLTAAEARELLLRRLGTKRVSAEPDAVDELSQLCAGLPLALAIVASRAALHPAISLAVLADALRDASGRLAALDAGEGVSVEAVFSWSHNQLPAPAGRMYRLLGIHPGPDITVASAASLAAVGSDEASSVLRQLEEASLLTEHAPGRFRFHDLLRSYAVKLGCTEENQSQQRAAIHRALDHYLHSAYAADRVLRLATLETITPGTPQPGVVPEPSGDVQQARTWFESEQYVLAALVGLAAHTGFDTHGWQLFMMLGGFFEYKGDAGLSVAVQQAALAAVRRLGDRHAQAQVHRHIGCTCVSIGALQDAEYHYHQALDLFEQLGDHAGQALAHLGFAKLRDRQARCREALMHSSRGIALSESGADQVFYAAALNAHGWCLARVGEYRQALAYCQKAIGLDQELGRRYSEACNWDSLGYVQRHLSQHAESISSYQQGLALFRQTGARAQEAITLGNLGDAYQAAAKMQLATQAWQQALAILDDLGHHHAPEILSKLQSTSDPDLGVPEPNF
jgi:tetratricopeptide (TPR) repeat protein/DNA-binding XRE family transcriptional regulator